METTRTSYLTYPAFMRSLEGDIRSIQEVYGDSRIRFLIENNRGGTTVYDIDKYGEMAEYRLSSHARRELQLGDYYLYNPEENSYDGGGFKTFMEGQERATRVLVTPRPDELSKEDLDDVKSIEKAKLLEQKRDIENQIKFLSK